MNHLSVPLALLALAVPLTACVDGGRGGRDCTAIAIPAVRVDVEDEDGSAVDGTTVVYEHDAEAPEPCEDADGGGWSCGYEVEGMVTVRAEADGYESAEETVDVPLDEAGCHPVTQDVVLTLSSLEE